MFLAPSMAATVQLCSLKRGSKKDLLKMHGGVFSLVSTCLWGVLRGINEQAGIWGYLQLCILQEGLLPLLLHRVPAKWADLPGVMSGLGWPQGYLSTQDTLTVN